MTTDKPIMDSAAVDASDASAARRRQYAVKAAGYLLERGTPPELVKSVLTQLKGHGIQPESYATLFGNLEKSGVPWDQWTKVIGNPAFDNKGAMQFIRPFVNGALMEWGDEAVGAMGVEDKNEYRIREAVTERAHPVASGAAKLTGAGLTAAATGGAGASALTARGAAPLAAQALAATGTGAGLGALTGAGQAGTMEEVPEMALKGGAVGGVLGGAGAIGTNVLGRVFGEVADAAFPDRVFSREIGAMTSTPQVRTAAAEAEALGHKASLAELSDNVAPIAKVAAETPGASRAAAQKANETVKAAALRVRRANEAYDNHTRAVGTLQLPAPIKGIVAQYEGTIRTQATARHLVDVLQKVRSKLSSSSANRIGFEQMKKDADALVQYIEREGVPITKLDVDRSVAEDMLTRATAADKAVRDAMGANAAGRITGSPGVTMSGSVHQGRPSLWGRMAGVFHGTNEAQAQRALDVFDPNALPGLMARGAAKPDETTLQGLLRIIGSPSGAGSAIGVGGSNFFGDR